MTLHLEKLYRYPRVQEHLAVAVPFRQGELTDIEKVCVMDKEEVLPIQCKATAKYKDGSIKYLFLRFMGDLPGNAQKEFYLDWTGKEKKNLVDALAVEEIANGYQVNNGSFWFQVNNDSNRLFTALYDGNQRYEGERFEGPYLEIRENEEILPVCDMTFEKWQIVEEGPLCVILKAKGIHRKEIVFEVKLTVWYGKPWVEVSYRLINTTQAPLEIGALGFYCKASEDSPVSSVLNGDGHGGMIKAVSGNRDSQIMMGDTQRIFRVKGTGNLKELEKFCPVESIRTCTGYSNYKTDFTVGAEGENVVETVTAERMMMESNEHFAEVFYGTFFADRTDERGGICATIYQAQQNFPKAVKADKDGLAVMLVPRGEDRVIMQPGMSREQRFLLHFHASDESLAELDNRSLIYQMPDRPVIDPKVFKESGVMPEIFPEKMNVETELMLIRRADGHNRVFGMLNWGDTFDANYTNQGRGGGKPVWANNEYDYPHACAMMYARTGTRRFLDYMLVAASHWQDVDICHYSEDPLWLGGQIEHTRGHVIGGKIVPSHEWVEGLLDYYHFTGDERGLESAIGIGENVLRLLSTPMYSKTGEMNARETGWALRTLTALYMETGDERWMEKSEWIVGHFKQWEADYGLWLSPYTDNTLIRVGFMISVAVGSLMRYYRVRPSEELKEMMIRAIDDLVENCRLDNGLFYYKELPSLQRLGNNTLLLEAMAIGYELTGEQKYLEAGEETFQLALYSGAGGGGSRRHIDDAVIWPGDSAKSFGQSFLPLATFDRAKEKAGMR
ncbi:MAG: hypothetical protein IJF07_00905 [Lachnospiraceae bacterium]|nr:hypothetical protein [Lachnospiraceae bacterium]